MSPATGFEGTIDQTSREFSEEYLRAQKEELKRKGKAVLTNTSQTIADLGKKGSMALIGMSAATGPTAVAVTGVVGATIALAGLSPEGANILNDTIHSTPSALDQPVNKGSFEE